MLDNFDEYTRVQGDNIVLIFKLFWLGSCCRKCSNMTPFLGHDSVMGYNNDDVLMRDTSCVFIISQLHVIVYSFRPKIAKLDFKKKKLTLIVVEDDDEVFVFVVVVVKWEFCV